MADYYRAQYFRVLDLINEQLKDRFQQGGLLTLENLEKILLTGQINPSLTEPYPELDHQSLAVQLPMFLAIYTVAEAAQIIRGLPVEVSSLFRAVETIKTKKVASIVSQHMLEAQVEQSQVYNTYFIVVPMCDFQQGNHVFLLLPNTNCKFLAQWQSPYTVVELPDLSALASAPTESPGHTSVPQGEDLTPTQ